MKTKIITNQKKLVISPERKLLLGLAEKGLWAIDTQTAVKKALKLKNNYLRAGENKYNLLDYKRIIVIGFGKSSGQAALALEEILGAKITGGAVISLKKEPLRHITSLVGTHPLPSLQNVKAAEEIKKQVSGLTETDLVICLVSGGGSALLCWDEQELEQNTKVYNEFLKVGQDIKELNLVRKHISTVKGGGLAKTLYPAQVLSLIFCDVPGNKYELVASGPTYPGTTSMYDAKKIIEKYSLGEFTLFENTAEEKYFKKVQNLPVVSNFTALSAIKAKGEELGYIINILKQDLTGNAKETLEILRQNSKPGQITAAGSEIKVEVTKTGGNGGRCQYLGMEMLQNIKENETLAAIASDGLDNSDSAGIIVDYSSKQRAKNLKLDIKKYQENFTGYDFFCELGHEQIFTGPTGSNVSDFIIYLQK